MRSGRTAALSLTAVEADVFATIRAVLSHGPYATVVRVAGGWVRDKLLQRDSSDLDLVTDDVSGVEFAQRVNEYLQQVRGEHVSRIGVIAQRPEQSKHLETAAFSVHGQEVDVNQLRSEKYSHQSRIPSIEAGTPLQDAQRRDLTINSLFYNINTEQIEDFDGRGLEDLEKGVIRTPLDPLETFRDDPLRVLRAIRFAARLEFSVDPGLAAAAQSSEIKEHLCTKISRERVGIEVGKMFASGNTLIAMQLLCDWGYYPIVFECPREYPPPTDSAEAAMRVVQHITLYAMDSSADERRRIYLGSMLSPIRERTIPAKKQSMPLSTYIILTSLKLRVADANDIRILHEQVQRLFNLVESSDWKEPDEWDDSQIVSMGHILCGCREMWCSAVQLAIAMKQPQPETDRLNRILEWIPSSSLHQCWTWSPIVKGKDIMRHLNVSGQRVGQLTKLVLEWQFLNPERTTSAALEYLESVEKDISPAQKPRKS